MSVCRLCKAVVRSGVRSVTGALWLNVLMKTSAVSASVVMRSLWLCELNSGLSGASRYHTALYTSLYMSLSPPVSVCLSVSESLFVL